MVARARPVLESQKMRARTVRETERSLTQGIEQLNKFLGVVGLVALLLGRDRRGERDQRVHRATGWTRWRCCAASARRERR